jgi:FKBP-type peptidyl-prolyl cis-trans isomerase
MRLLVTAGALALAIVGRAAECGEEGMLETEQGRISYAIGRDIGTNLQKQGITLDPEAVAAGMRDAFAGTSAMTDQQMQETIMAFQMKMREQAKQRSEQQSGTNKEEAAAFMAKNKERPEVITLASGLQYEVITAGEGERPTRSDTVRVHYRGTLLDGTEFDSSYARGEPIEFPVTGVIKGWTEALQLMNVGAKWKLYIPPELGYGERGAGQDIGPNAALIFEVELLGVKGK